MIAELKMGEIRIGGRVVNNMSGTTAASAWCSRATRCFRTRPSSELSSSACARQSKKSSVTYKGLGEGVTFLTEPMKQETEITGPIAAKLWVSSATQDADLFLVMRIFSADMKEIVFQGALDPKTPVAQGWLRVSHRKLDKKLSLPYRPYHTHNERQKLKPGEVYEVDVEVWPTCIVVPAGYRIALLGARPGLRVRAAARPADVDR